MFFLIQMFLTVLSVVEGELLNADQRVGTLAFERACVSVLSRCYKGVNSPQSRFVSAHLFVHHT